jgi:glycosyltransferase involved in cell wall biosynthesis
MNIGNNPLVSVGMAVRNCANTLSITIRSILQQSYSHWELLLVDDGSSDGTVGVARGFPDHRIRVIVDGRKAGLPARLNQAISLARGKYFARMDGDDIAYPERLERQIGYLQRHMDVDLLGTRTLTFGRDGEAVGGSQVGESHAEICRYPRAGFLLPHPTWMGAMEWFRAHPYCPAMQKCQDQDLLLRTYRHSRFACIPEILLGYRQEQLSLRKIMISRYYSAKILLRNAFADNDYNLALGLPGQALKAAVDVLAVVTGLNYTILRHRALPVSAADLQRWREVWSAVNEPPVEIDLVQA